MKCDNCGAQGLPRESRFCSSCGSGLSSSVDEPRTETNAQIGRVPEFLANGARVARSEMRTGVETLRATPPVVQATPPVVQAAPLPVSQDPEPPERTLAVPEAQAEANSEEAMPAAQAAPPPVSQGTEPQTREPAVSEAGVETRSKETTPAAQAAPLPVSQGTEPQAKESAVSEAVAETSSVETRLAGFWRRVGGRFVDGLIVLAIGIIPAIAIYSVVYEAVLPSGFQTQDDVDLAVGSATFAVIGFYIVFGALYAIVGWASGGTPGMRAVGLRLQATLAKGSPGFGRAVARLLVSIVSCLALFLGFIGMVWNKDRQTWHDAAAGTVVVESR